MINDEKGLFVFRPWWFVIIVMIISIVAGLFRQQNNVPKKSVNLVNDYIPSENRINAKLSNIYALTVGKLIIRMPNFVLVVLIH